MNVFTILLIALGAGLFAGWLVARYLDRVAGDAWDPRCIEGPVHSEAEPTSLVGFGFVTSVMEGRDRNRAKVVEEKLAAYELAQAAAVTA